MTKNLIYARCGDYYIPNIKLFYNESLNGTAFPERCIHISKNTDRPQTNEQRSTGYLH